MAEDLNSGRPRTKPASGHSGTRTQDRRIASRTRRPLGHPASLSLSLSFVPKMAVVERFGCNLIIMLTKELRQSK